MKLTMALFAFWFMMATVTSQEVDELAAAQVKEAAQIEARFFVPPSCLIS